MVRAVLFDLDGTLIDTNELIIDSFKHTFKVLKDIEPERDQIISWFGEPLFKTMGKFFDDVEEAISIYREYNLNHHDERISLYNNTKEMLISLRKRGYKLGIVTSKNKGTALKGLEFLGIRDYFDAIVTSDDVENHKPHREPVLKACGLLSIPPEEVIMVGDSMYDILSGRSAGSKTCGVLFSLMRDKLLESKADYYVNDLIEVLDIVESDAVL